MGKEYKTLINKALERFYFRLSASGAHAERAARDSLTRAIRSLYDVAFYATSFSVFEISFSALMIPSSFACIFVSPLFACANTSVNTDGFHVFLFNLMFYLYRYSPVKKRSIFFTE